MITKRSLIASILLIAGLVTTAKAADPEVGKRLYQATCVACHGEKGISVAPIYPNLVSQKEQYLVSSMKAYRDGDRTDPIMAPMAKGLSNTDIANLASYLTRLKMTDTGEVEVSDANDTDSTNASAQE